MTVSEIHINMGILLQKVNTHRGKNFLPQELDMLFNLTLNTFKRIIKTINLISLTKKLYKTSSIYKYYYILILKEK